MSEVTPLSNLREFDTAPIRSLSLNDKPVGIRKLKTIDVLRFLATMDEAKGRLKLTRSEIGAADFTGDQVAKLVVGLVESCMTDFDLKTDTVRENTLSELILTTIGKLFGVDGRDVLHSDGDELYTAVEALWEVNASGPLGKAIRGIIASFKTRMAPRIALLVDVLMMNLESIATKGRRLGGMDDGGVIAASDLFTDPTNGASDSVSTSLSPPSSTTSPASPPSSDFAPPSPMSNGTASPAIDPMDLAAVLDDPATTTRPASSPATSDEAS